GLQRRPEDVSLNHRMGQILRDRGNAAEAVAYLRRATKTKESFASYTSLADLYLQLGEVHQAVEVMSRYPGPKDKPAYHNVMGNIARIQERFIEAEKHFATCEQSGDRGVRTYGSIAQLRLDQGRKALEAAAWESALAYVTQAEVAVEKGLRVEAENRALVRLKKDAGSMRLAALEKLGTKGA
ncbi:MAG: tetratricopeptide repeat protein, partial [Deltaproteobacteria bacterium]